MFNRKFAVSVSDSESLFPSVELTKNPRAITGITNREQIHPIETICFSDIIDEFETVKRLPHFC